MTRINFYTHVPHQLGYACRLTRKVYASGQKLMVVGETATLGAFDEALWTFAPLEFIPHCWLDSALSPHTPVILAPAFETAPHYQALLNLGPEMPSHFARFERVLEVVSADSDALESARQRYRFYRDRGYPLNNYNQRAYSQHGAPDKL